jgi:hypothetical protein
MVSRIRSRRATQKPNKIWPVTGVTAVTGDLHKDTECEADDGDIPAQFRRCAQCNDVGELEPHKAGDRLVWLHDLCVKYWKKEQMK